MMPTWLADHIEKTTGLAPGDRNTRTRRCRPCRTTVLIGLDNDVCAFRAIVDPAPLNPLGEALALLTGRQTYKLTRHGKAWRLTLREWWHISDRTPATRGDILATHVCGSPPLPGQPSMFARPTPAADHLTPPLLRSKP